MSTVSSVLPGQILDTKYRFTTKINNVPDYYVQNQPSRRKQTQCQCPVWYMVKNLAIYQVSYEESKKV
jgi:hypothetical protein